jgi:phosphatidylethanolamine/phosphatidyl-N-methylethanolamine N-methyltransferase
MSAQVRGEALLFLRTWLRAPLKTAAYGPSSPALAREVARMARPAESGPVVELGAGTGALTQALVEAGVAPSRLILFEADSGFAAMLERRFPGVGVIGGDAYRAPEALGPIGASAIVSGLPLVQHPGRARFVLDCLRTIARPGARFVQLTYMPGSPVPLRQIPDVEAQASRTVWRNFPPARVWAYQLRP